MPIARLESLHHGRIQFPHRRPAGRRLHPPGANEGLIVVEILIERAAHQPRGDGLVRQPTLHIGLASALRLDKRQRLRGSAPRKQYRHHGVEDSRVPRLCRGRFQGFRLCLFEPPQFQQHLRQQGTKLRRRALLLGHIANSRLGEFIVAAANQQRAQQVLQR